MEKKQFTFTKDYLDCIAQAGLFTHLHDKRIIQADDVVLGIYTYTSRFSFCELFWKFFGITDHSILRTYIRQLGEETVKPAQGAKMTFQLAGFFQEQFTMLKREGIQRLNFLALLYAALKDISPDLRAYLASHGIDVETMRTKLLKVVKVTHNVDVAPNDFFKTLETMLENLNLDVEQMEMFVDMGTITGEDLESEAVLDST